MRAVIDTNVLLSGLLWRGTPHRLLEAVRGGALTLITSPALLAELGDRDPDDDATLALAVAAQADLLITGDADLLVLGDHAGIPIIDAATALALIGG